MEEKGTETRFSIILCHFSTIQKLRYSTKQNYNYLEKDTIILLRDSDSLYPVTAVLVNKKISTCGENYLMILITSLVWKKGFPKTISQIGPYASFMTFYFAYRWDSIHTEGLRVMVVVRNTVVKWYLSSSSNRATIFTLHFIILMILS